MNATAGGSVPAAVEQTLAACGGAETVFSNTRAFVAKCKNGTLAVWGNINCIPFHFAGMGDVSHFGKGHSWEWGS